MNTKTTISLAIAAGFLGGIASQSISPIMAHAQAQPPIPKEIRAESFVIVDENGLPRGAFGIDKKGFPMVEATDAKGHVYWIRWGESFFGKGKPSLAPLQ